MHAERLLPRCFSCKILTEYLMQRVINGQYFKQSVICKLHFQYRKVKVTALHFKRVLASCNCFGFRFAFGVDTKKMLTKNH